MRFDDSLETVLSGDMSSPIGAQLAWRQLVDLVGRGRVEASDRVIERLRSIRAAVPPPVRTASARAVADASPPLSLVTLFAEDEIAVAAPVLRVVQLVPADWAELLPLLSPTGRSIVRHRRDLPCEVIAMLASFGSVDFVLASPDAPSSSSVDFPITTPSDPDPMVPESVDPAPVEAEVAAEGRGPSAAPNGASEIADMLKRIAAFQRARASSSRDSAPANDPVVDSSEERFTFETDSAGVIRWVEGVSRTTMIGFTLAQVASEGLSGVDAAVAEAFKERSAFADLGLFVAGQSDAAGAWRLSAVPLFDRATGRFNGYRGNACRPHPERVADGTMPNAAAIADALRQLVHELRTPTNAIAGFAEMIETEMLGPVPEVYRGEATEIRNQTADLLVAIEDMDAAARIEADAAQPRSDGLSIADMLDRIATDLAPLATLRGATIALHGLDETLRIQGDGRAIERLTARLLATLVAATNAREQIGVVVSRKTPSRICLVFDRPRDLASPADEPDWDNDTRSLGTGFALRLTGKLASELGGTLDIDRTVLTLELPIGDFGRMEQVRSN